MSTRIVKLKLQPVLARCEPGCKDGAGASKMRGAAHTALRRAAGAMSGAREDLVELLRVDGLKVALN